LRAGETVKKAYLNRANLVGRLFKAILPDPEAAALAPEVTPITVIAQKILSQNPAADISGVMGEIERILDRSIAAEGYIIRDTPGSKLINLAEVDFAALAEKFRKGRKRTEFERLKILVEETLNRLVEENRSRMDFLERFQRLIDEYNAGSANIEELWAQLVAFAKSLNEEARRHVSERLTEEELALFDILTRPGMELTDKERDQVKGAARELLETLKAAKLVIDWRKRQAARAAVRHHIEVFLDENLPERYSRDLYTQKCEDVYQHFYDAYYGGGRSLYA
jgi:type I restriction enzyme R subunit